MCMTQNWRALQKVSETAQHIIVTQLLSISVANSTVSAARLQSSLFPQAVRPVQLTICPTAVHLLLF